MTTLFVQDGESSFAEATSELIIITAAALLKRQLRAGAQVLSSPSIMQRFLKFHLGDLEHEVFGLVYLDAHQRLIAVEDMLRGSVSGVNPIPREIIKAALKHNAMGVVCYHNHPSGIAEPSTADELFSRRLREALSVIDVHLLDHWIVAGDEMRSFRECDLL